VTHAFPWAGGVPSVYGAGTQVPRPPAAPASFFVKRAAVGDSPEAAQGAVTFKVVTDTIVMPNSNTTWMGYGRTVPASGALRFAFVYSRATTAAEVGAMATAAQQAVAPPPCVVPRTLGLTLTVARARLHAANCTIGAVRHEYSTKTASGKVKAQAQKAGTTLPNNGRVELTVSRGKPKK
jgi:PASTA domain